MTNPPTTTAGIEALLLVDRNEVERHRVVAKYLIWPGKELRP
jgi:hypothetical protein